jgi:hypothetical protein
MKKTHDWAGICLALLLVYTNQASAGSDFSEWLTSYKHMSGVKPVDNTTYLEECGSCHFAYQPGLLPAASWKKILNSQAMVDHFGENAEMDESMLQRIRIYAMDNAADKSYYKLSRKVVATTKDGTTPLRITELRFMRRKHHDIPEKMVMENNQVKSLSYCNACHTKAVQGIFDEDTVSIPNYPDYR